ncbi:hypothetical protein FFLO_06849 [Filobasidium floriforme]|uniref:Uncharacterized protein n=1 Tax=Filobasidium floriforme TaxID=5210 RepID=A0A8K0JE33_9TREE|nr:uncharacterized protein HD553DRAFT_219523 [Filobasidium floriforme]KAG7527518.1 hypothetical protein FFLO_06849 [Filobasidium floriforme]KAH8086499.1 hypothetical protein HD553DRAFT_219523 [Filobasidium floriforme]
MTPPIKLDTVHPSWTIGRKSPVVTTPPAVAPIAAASTTIATPTSTSKPIPTGPNPVQPPASTSKPKLPPTGPASISIRRPASTANPVSGRPSGFSIRDSANRSTSNNAGDKRPGPSLLGRLAESTPKRKREQEPIASPVKTPSLASRLGIHLPGSVTPTHEQDHNRKKQKSDRDRSGRSDRAPTPPSRTGAIPNLLARMNSSGPTPNRPVPTPAERPISPAIPSDGVQRRGRGWANAGIDLAPSAPATGGFSIRGRTPSSATK